MMVAAKMPTHASTMAGDQVARPARTKESPHGTASKKG
jgi:hypothetical protein